jgi:FdhE protein
MQCAVNQYIFFATSDAFETSNRLRVSKVRPDNLAVSNSPWQQRIRRAEKLAAHHAFAAEILAFYVQIARFQQDLFGQLKPASHTPGVIGTPINDPGLIATFPDFLSVVESHGPRSLAEVANELRGRERVWLDLLNGLWSGADAPHTPEEFLGFAFLQPYAERARESEGLQIDGYTGSLCPLCNRKPAQGVLRPMGDGGRRSLLCGFCLTEWEFRRIICPGCGEEEPVKLPVYTAAEMPHIRVECCDTCHGYIKSIDFTKNGLADPLVDELASVPLNLWAQERGYTKLHPNLLGM